MVQITISTVPLPNFDNGTVWSIIMVQKSTQNLSDYLDIEGLPHIVFPNFHHIILMLFIHNYIENNFLIQYSYILCGTLFFSNHGMS